MRHASRLIFAFAVLFAVFLIGPAVLAQQFSPYPLVKVGDVFDLLTPLVLLPCYWLLLEVSSERPPGRAATFSFLVLAGLWAEGQGMHLAANSIGHLLVGTTTDAAALTYFYDEILSHYLWHASIIALSALIIGRAWTQTSSSRGINVLIILAALFYGTTFFAMTVEGNTTLLGIPFAILVALLGAIKASRQESQPVLVFFILAYVLATILFAIWGLYWGGFPQFSETGMI